MKHPLVLFHHPKEPKISSYMKDQHKKYHQFFRFCSFRTLKYTLWSPSSRNALWYSMQTRTLFLLWQGEYRRKIGKRSIQHQSVSIGYEVEHFRSQLDDKIIFHNNGSKPLNVLIVHKCSICRVIVFNIVLTVLKNKYLHDDQRLCQSQSIIQREKGRFPPYYRSSSIRPSENISFV